MIRLDIFNKKHVLRLLIAANLLLIVLYLLSSHFISLSSWSLVNWFDLNAEANIPTWFSSAQLLLLFALAVGLSVVCSRQGRDKHLARFYVVVGLAFLFFSMDETAVIHEAVSVGAQKLEAYLPFENCHAVWICVYGFVLLAVAFVFRKGLWTFLKEAPGRKALFAGGITFVCGGCLVDEIALYFLEGTYGPTTWVGATVITLEEGLELLGQSLMIYAFMAKLEATGISLSRLVSPGDGITEPESRTTVL